jgi:hypothetical protein
VATLHRASNKQDFPIEFLYSDFRDVDGVKWPFTEKASSPAGGVKQTITWSKIETNQPVDESLFKAPNS